MKAVRLYDARDLRLENVAPPAEPPAGFVNLRVRAAGICGSDLHNYQTGQWITRRPSTAGHEFCGSVTAIGEGVANCKIGDLVSVDSRICCGECVACKEGRTNVCEKLGFVGEICDGGFADEVQVPARLIVHHNPTLPARIAAMAEPLAVALHAVRRLRPEPKQSVLIIGCGAIGGLCALLLSKMHHAEVLLSDLNPARLSLVAEVTGGAPVDLAKPSVERVLKHGPLRAAIDATGNVNAIDAGIRMLAGGGTLVLVGISHSRIELDPNVLVEREISLLGCHAFADEFPEAAGLLPSLRAELDRLIDVLSGWHAVPESYATLLKGGSGKLKTIVELEK